METQGVPVQRATGLIIYLIYNWAKDFLPFTDRPMDFFHNLQTHPPKRSLQSPARPSLDRLTSGLFMWCFLGRRDMVLPSKKTWGGIGLIP